MEKREVVCATLLGDARPQEDLLPKNLEIRLLLKINPPEGQPVSTGD